MQVSNYVFGPLASVTPEGAILEDGGAQALNKTLATLPCRLSGYCSLGSVKGFHGSVATSALAEIAPTAPCGGNVWPRQGQRT